MKQIVQSLWIGNQLTKLEQLAICSHLHFGHEFHLYVYEDVKGIPAGTVVKNGEEILPKSEIFAYETAWGKGSFSAFSNFFRYKLLCEKGEWWVDTDVVCLKAFDWDRDFVAASEIMEEGWVQATTCAIKTPPDFLPVEYCWQRCQEKDKSKIVWGEVGPQLWEESIRGHNLTGYVLDPFTFCPVPYYDFARVLSSEAIDLSRSYAIHLWNEMWRRNAMDKDGEYPKDCLYERLKRDFLRSGKHCRVF